MSFSNLDKLMQMVAIEQLTNMTRTSNENLNLNSSKEILSLPLVQKVIIAYEEELKQKKTTDCHCHNYSNQFELLSSNYEKQNILLNSLTEKLEELTNLVLSNQTTENYESKSGTQLKLTSFPGFFKNNNKDIIDLSNDDYEPLIKEELVSDNITLNIEEINGFVSKNELETYVFDELDVPEDVFDVPEDVFDELEDVLINELETELETELVDELETKLVDELETELVDELETELETELVDELVDELETELEDELETELEDELETKLEDELETELEDELEDELETELVDELETKVKEEVKEEVLETDEEVGTDEEVLEEDDEEEVFEIEIDDEPYFATDEENGTLYEIDLNGEVGKKVGIIKDGEPIFL